MVIIRDFGNKFNINKIRLVYGRRKTGKSFFVENFTTYDKYLFIYRDKSIKDIKTNENWSYNELKRYILDNTNKTIVIDEFHRLNTDFLDFLHSKRFNNLILITSSLHIAKEILNKRSPILGLIYPIEFGLIKPCEILNYLKSAKLFEYSLFFREPTLVELYSPKDTFEEFLMKYYDFAKYWSIALFGEIFEDEDKKLTETYEGIIRAISLGKENTGNITTYLYNNNLIKKDNPGFISAYIDTLVKIGVLNKLEIFGKKKRYIYKLKSAPIDFFFYIDSKYKNNISSKELVMAWNNKVSFYIERFISDLISENKGLSKIRYNYPNKEIDIVLKKFTILDTIGSVKWKDISKVDLKEVERNLDIKENVKNKFLFVKNKNKINKYKNIVIYEPKDLNKFCE
jgi:hypothetical protein